MSKFKVGDHVICVRPDNRKWVDMPQGILSSVQIPNGAELTVKEIDDGYLVFEETGKNESFNPMWFEKKKDLSMQYVKREEIEKENPNLILVN